MTTLKQEKCIEKKIGLRLIVADLVHIQSRAAMNKGFEREFSEIMAESSGWGRFPAVVVFFDGETYWLADGFHRYFAAVKAGLRDALCEVRVGTKRDAIIFSACANIAFSIVRTGADKARAARLLLEDAEWFKMTDGAIAKQIRVDREVVRKARVKFCRERGIRIPKHAVTADGRRVKRRVSRDTPPSVMSVPLYADEIKAMTLGNIKEFMDRKHISAERVAAIDPTNTCQGKYAEIAGLKGNGWVGVGSDFESGESFRSAVGGVLWLRANEWSLSDCRAIVFCRREDGPLAFFATAELLGIEFLAPEEFVESLKKS